MFQEMQSALNAGTAAFGRDARGGVAMMFGFAAPVLLLAVGVSASYVKGIHDKSRVQVAADNAALFGVQEVLAHPDYANNTAGDNWQKWNKINKKIEAYFYGNLLTEQGGVTTSTQPYINTDFTNGVATVTVSAQGKSFPLLQFATDRWGPGLKYNVASTAQAAAPALDSTVTTNTITGFLNGPYANTYIPSCASTCGGGAVEEDPHLIGPDGSDRIIDCPDTTHWFNLLSDHGVQVNIRCGSDVQIYNGVTYVAAVALTIDGHKILIDPSHPTYDANANKWIYDGNAFNGGFTLDGVNYPAVSGYQKYGDGLVITRILEPSQYYYYRKDTIFVGSNHYSFAITGSTITMLDVSIAGLNVGAQGTPGGFFGQTFAGLYDLDMSHFAVDGPFATTYQYDWADRNPAPIVTVSSSGSKTRLTK